MPHYKDKNGNTFQLSEEDAKKRGYEPTDGPTSESSSTGPGEPNGHTYPGSQPQAKKESAPDSTPPPPPAK